MKKYNSVFWSVAIKNSVVMICFTALAIYFGKWWIALFAYLLLSEIKWKETEKPAIDSPLDKP